MFRWFGHIGSVDEELKKRILGSNVGGVRLRGRP